MNVAPPGGERGAQGALAKLGKARIPRRVVQDRACAGGGCTAGQLGVGGSGRLKGLRGELHRRAMRDEVISVVNQAGVVGAVARLLWGRESRKLRRGHEPRELEDTLEGAEAAPEVGELRGPQGAEDSRGHRAVPPPDRRGGQRAEGGVIREGGPAGVAVEGGHVADRDSEEVDLRSSAVRGEGRTRVGEGGGTEVVQCVGPILNKASFTRTGGGPLGVEIASTDNGGSGPGSVAVLKLKGAAESGKGVSLSSRREVGGKEAKFLTAKLH